MRFATEQDFKAALAVLPGPDEGARASARVRQATLTKPPGSLGRLEDIACHIAAWGRAGGQDGSSESRLVCERIHVAVFAGNHGVAARGVSPYPTSVTAQMVANFARGGAAINALATSLGLTLSVVPLDLDRPTGDIAATDAMSPAETLAALDAGARAIEGPIDLLVVGEMGIGNTTVAAALAYATCGGNAADWTGPGTGLDAAGVRRKCEVVAAAVARCRDCETGDAFHLFARLGGRELAAIAGAVLAARHARIPVVLDGYVATAAVAPLYTANAQALDHCLAGHCSAEPAHARLLAALGLAPVLDLGMRLGEGTGAALASAVIRSAVAAHNGMATFGEAGVDEAG